MRSIELDRRSKAIVPLAALGVLAVTSLVALLVACGSKPSPPIPNAVQIPVLVTPPDPAPATPPSPPPLPPVVVKKVSQARTTQEYRKDAASHLYALNQSRLYPGKLPQLLHAVGVLQLQIDPRGNVSSLSWLRAPRHAPEVMAEIERSVRQAAPFPMPVRIGKVTYTDTWLWHSSGQFQLHTLTEGQL